jgi:hypothetical protein
LQTNKKLAKRTYERNKMLEKKQPKHRQAVPLERYLVQSLGMKLLWMLAKCTLKPYAPIPN